MKSSPHNTKSFAQSEVPGLSLSEIVGRRNQTAMDYPRERTVALLFEEVAPARLESVAVEFTDERLTYSELNTRANRVARLLRRMGVGADTITQLER